MNISTKKRELKDSLDDLLTTAYRDGEFVYVNSEMVIEAIEFITEKVYYETQGDLCDDLDKIVKVLKFE